jgi:hypothetical protein
MADDNADLMAEFQEFLTAKRESENAEKDAEDFEVEIWDEKGRGIRTKRSHAKPFLQSLGIDLDPESDNDKGDDDKSGGKAGSKSGRQSTGKVGNATGSQSVTRKYFTKTPKP